MRTIWCVLSHAAALAIAPLILASCAELGEFSNDITRLRSDLQANAQTLSQISARVDELERRQADMESTTRQTQQELSQGLKVLLRKALIAENRQTIREAGKSQPKDAEKPESQARQLAPAGQGASLPWEDPHQGRKQLSLGMTQDDVRRILGEPISIEQVGSYVFWQYSPMSNQQYVIFETVNGRVSGWRGL
jgi:TolA-binding protein